MASKRKRIEDADVAERLARLERIADMLDRGEISLPRDDKGNEANGFYADDMERVADFAEDMRGRFHIRAMAESLAKVTPRYPEDFRKSTSAIARYIEANSHDMLAGVDKNADPTHNGLSKVDITARRSKGKGKTPDNVYVWTGIYPDESVLQAHGAPSLNPFDFAVLNAVNTLYMAGNHWIWAAMVARTLGVKATEKTTKDIQVAFSKLKNVNVWVDATDEAAKYNSKGTIKDTVKQFGRAVLPYTDMARIISHGQVINNAILLDKEPPLLSYSRERGQFQPIPAEMLESGKIRKTSNAIVVPLKLYLAEKVCEATSKGNESVTCKFRTLCQRVGIPTDRSNTSRMARLRFSKTVYSVLDAWEADGFIESWEPRDIKKSDREKQNKGTTPISFDAVIIRPKIDETRDVMEW